MPHLIASLQQFERLPQVVLAFPGMGSSHYVDEIVQHYPDVRYRLLSYVREEQWNEDPQHRKLLHREIAKLREPDDQFRLRYYEYSANVASLLRVKGVEYVIEHPPRGARALVGGYYFRNNRKWSFIKQTLNRWDQLHDEIEMDETPFKLEARRLPSREAPAVLKLLAGIRMPNKHVPEYQGIINARAQRVFKDVDLQTVRLSPDTKLILLDNGVSLLSDLMTSCRPEISGIEGITSNQIDEIETMMAKQGVWWFEALKGKQDGRVSRVA